ncbi:PAS domain S-box protein [Maribellus comscasis]|uniref:histidine kinase n=1 Tax=Maribellus comscasis TaxID=2681766 RepID=A0A6I6JZK3_9BACT|nr:PAS domain S-box protein [Maribellus comscasis]QGY46598.1 PAS domain S-box protein [Maribellus comscasis]
MRNFFSVGLMESDALYLESIMKKAFPGAACFSYKKTTELFNPGNSKPPDLIFLASQLKSTDSAKACIRLKDALAFKDVPVIVLNYDSEEKILKSLLDAGVDAFLSKPFTGAECIALVNTLLKSRTGKQNTANEPMELLQESEKRYRYMFENNPQPMLIYDLETLEFLTVNRAAIDHYGYSADEFLSMTIKDIRPPEDIDALLDDVEKTYKVYNNAGEWRHLKKNGELLYVEIISHALTFNGRRARHVMVRDITDRKMAESSLQENLENLRITLDSIGDAVISTDLNGRIIRMNPVAESLTGWELEQVKGKLLNEIFHIANAKTNKTIENPVEKVISSGQIVGMANHTKLISKNGVEYQISDSAAPITDSRGKIKGVVLVFRDVTKEYEIRNKLEENEERLRAATNNLDGILYVVDKNLIITLSKGLGLEKLRLKPDQVVGQTLYEYYKTDDPNHSMIQKHRRVLGGEHLALETQHGDTYFSTKVSPVKNIAGEITGAIGLVTDVTEKMKINKRLRESEEKYRTVFENTGSATCILENDGTISLCNSKFAQLAALPLAQIQNIKKWMDFVVQEDLESMVQQHKSRRIKGEQTLNEYEFRFMDANKKEKNIHLFIDIIQGTNKSVASLLDISEIKNTEKKLRERERELNISNERWKFALEGAGDGVWDWDIINNKVIFSDQWKVMLGYEPSEIENNFDEWEKRVHPEDLEKALTDLKNHLDEESSEYVNEHRLRCKDGSYKWILDRGKVISRDNSGAALRMIGIHTDITERREMVEALVLAKEKAEESDRLKSAFLANMSHEIRTPMNGILGFADLLKTPTLSSLERQQFVQIIESSGHRMLTTINDLIDISKIEAGMIDIKLSKINVNEQLEYLYYFFKPETERKGLELIYKKNNELISFNFKTDREKLMAVLTNLIKNAVKYTDKGKVEYSFEVKNGIIGFLVEDTGIGIGKEYQKTIFDRFVQADLSTTKPYEGAGLGLSITKAYVEMLKGKIKLTSDIGKGSKFYVSFPLKRSDEKITYKQQPDFKNKDVMDGIKDINILVVEDDRIGKMYMETLFRNRSKNLLFASNGIEAVEICESNKDIDLILMDIKMPLMDGYEATRKIKSINSNIIIVAQTAFALAGDEEKALEAGCDAYVTKPIKKENLFKVISKYFSY